MQVIPLPGDLICDWVGLDEGSDHRQILRILLNTIWSVLLIGVALRARL